ncbi:MAG: DUF1853 family protein [Verrucomicrobiales bacterium]
MSFSTTTMALLQSLVSGPLLLGDLPEASSFPYQKLSLPGEFTLLNLQQKLGHLYEDALAILIDHSPRWELLARNLQIQSDIHTTLGELDFLLRDLNTDQLVHLELATKFYLAVETGSELLLPGPDARDNYARKLSLLRSHQLKLPEKHPLHLPKKYRDEPIVTNHLIYGCLFDHINAPSPTFPEFLNPDCRRGKWLTISEISSFFSAGTNFELIPKYLWPVPFQFLTNHALSPWKPETTVERCLMVRPDNSHHPFFITPDSYPESLKIKETHMAVTMRV